MKYLEMFDRNIGVFSIEEQNKIKNLKVAIIGCGGMGGVTAQVLARTGVVKFVVADPDKYEVVNINNQFTAFIHTLGKNKASVVSEFLKTINHDISVKAFPEGVNDKNVKEIVDNADIVYDCVDFNEIYFSYLVVNEARKQGKFVLAPQAVGYGGSVLVFDPNGMSFNEYYGYKEGMQKGEVDRVVVPPERFTHVMPDYINKDVISKTLNKEIPIPNIALAQTLASSVMVSESLMIILEKRKPIVVPKVISFDLLKKSISE